MRGLNPAKTREHRRQQAERSFPLLRGAPNTAAIGLVGFLDRLSADEQLLFADQLSDFAEVQQAYPTIAFEERVALLRSLPLVERHFGKHLGSTASAVPSIDVRLLPVKVLAAVLNDEVTGGFQGWAKVVRLSEEPEARAPAAAHAAFLEEVVPVASRRLRKLISDAMKKKFGAGEQRVESEHTQFTAQIAAVTVKFDVMFAKGGGSRHQFDYHLSTKIGELPLVAIGSYEGVWLTSGRWDYVTETNAERSVAHLIRQIEMCLELA
jgi:hypothetical protein